MDEKRQFAENHLVVVTNVLLLSSTEVCKLKSFLGCSVL